MSAHPALLFAIGQNCEGAANLRTVPLCWSGRHVVASGLLIVVGEYC